MKKRGKTGKKTKQSSKRKGSLSSDDEQVSASCSLPPAVEGQLRCFLTVSVSKFIWAVDTHPHDAVIRIWWWGERGPGTILRPLPTGQARKAAITASTKWTPARYPVCSGPKQFAAYLNDMGSLVLEAVHKSTHIPFGKAMLSEITNLTASQPVNVILPLMAVISPFNKLADLQVFIKFESVSAAYNKLSSAIPTVDTVLDKENVDISNPHPTPPPYLNPATPVTHPKHHRAAEDPFESPAPAKGVKFSEEPPEQLEYTLDPSLFSFLEDNAEATVPSGAGLPSEMSDETTVANYEQDPSILTPTQPSLAIERDDQDQGVVSNMDWIGALLDRGQRLREGLAMSSLLDDNNVSQYIEPEHSPPDRHVLPGRLFQEILSSNKTSPNRADKIYFDQSLDHSTEQPSYSEDKVIDLLMGEQHGLDFMDESHISDDLSEIGHPIHDDSLLMDLFYKTQANKSGGSDTDDTVTTDEEQDSTLTNISVEDVSKLSKRRQPKKIPARQKQKEEEEMPRNFKEDETSSIGDLEVDIPPVNLIEDATNFTMTTESAVQSSSDMVQSLGTDTLTTLGRVNTARVIFDKLELADFYAQEKQNVNKKPRLERQLKDTFFVEYFFPITSAKGATRGKSMATEVTRVASKRIREQDRAVLFNHRSVFPVSFNAAEVDQWWTLPMSFRVFKRDSGQRQPLELGQGVFPLKAVLLSATLSHTHLIEINKVDKQYSESSSTALYSSQSSPPISSYHPSHSDSTHRPPQVCFTGKLEVKVELGIDGKEVHAMPVSRLPMSTMVTLPQHAQPIITMVSRPVVISGSQSVPQFTSHKEAKDTVKHKPPLPKVSQFLVKEPTLVENPVDVFTLHSLLWIPEGKAVTLEPHGKDGCNAVVPGIGGRTNLFLVARMFWCEEVSKSAISWGSSNPQFGFKQVAPVLLTPTLLQRACNNFMVIEVWNKVIPQGEKLIGIVKLPLHQFYLSYRDPKITTTLMKSKFPVMCIDQMISITNPFTGSSHGELKVLLAMGSEDQISSLLAIKGGSGIPGGLSDNRPSHHLDQPSERQVKGGHSPKNSSIVDHQFEITVEDIRGLSVFKNTVWGETDCYVQYHFPQQNKTSGDLDNQDVPGLKAHHTATTLCVPDPSFQDVSRHSFVLPPGVPVQRYLLAAYSGSWTSVSSIPGSGGVPFELWRRYYYPNVRDQLVAKASLPVAKLCAMVTMQKHREPSVQTFSLPLTVLPGGDKSAKQMMIVDSGLLDVTIKYHAHKVQTADDPNTMKQGDDQVCLSVDIIRACGLKEAAGIHADSNPSMSYPADVGVNAYVVTKLPIGRKTRHVTRTVARTFAPEFTHHMEVMTPLQISRKSHGSKHQDYDEKTISLAEKLEMSEAVFEVWHQHTRGFGKIESHQEHHNHPTKNSRDDVLLGVVSVPLADLLTHRTGIRGWHTIKPDQDHFASGDYHGLHGNNITLGGLQLAIKFEDPEDREAVVHAGRSVGWSPFLGVEHDGDNLLESDDEDDEGAPKGLELSVKISRAWVPESFVQHLQEHSSNSRHELKGYVRYKLYDKSPLCSRVVRIKQAVDKMYSCDVKHFKGFIVPATPSLVWYLREESLEVQVWLRSHSRQGKDATLPGKKDKLVGSAFINLSSIIVSDLHHSQTSGLFPLFKAGTDSLDGASVHVQISLAKPNVHSNNYHLVEPDALDESISSDDYPSTRDFADNDSTSLKSSTQPHGTEQHRRDLGTKNQPTSSAMSAEDEDSFAAHVIVQEAHHLTTVAGGDGKRVAPNASVSYQTSVSSQPVTTPVCMSSTCPVWEFEKLEKFQLSSLKSQNLVFKVWHKPSHPKDGTGDASSNLSDNQPIGFVSVDLAPLAAGLRQLIGWYNIMDFNGECKGQIMVGVVPLAPVSPSRCLTKSRLHLNTLATGVSQTRLFQSTRREQQTSMVNTDLLSSQRQSQLMQLRSLDGNDADELNNKGPVINQSASSTSFLFRQLRQNMKDLDNLQKGLQAKLTCADDHGTHGNTIPSDEIPPHQSDHLFLQESHKKTPHSTDCGLERNEYKDYTTQPNGGHNESVSYFMASVKPRDFLDEDIPGKVHSHLQENGEKLVEPKISSGQPDNPLYSETQLNLAEPSNVTENTASEAISRAVHNSIKYTFPATEPLEDADGYSAENLAAYGSDHEDSLGDSSLYIEDTESPTAQKFTQERDSWLSSAEEDEDTKSPLNANVFSLTENCEQQRQANESSDSSNHASPQEKSPSDVSVHLEDEECEVKEAMKVFDGVKPSDFSDSGPESPEFLQGNYYLSRTSGEVPDNECHTDSNTNSENQTRDQDRYPSDKHTAPSLPNFFMPTQELEHSMRALRLGAKLGYSHSLPPVDSQTQSKLIQRSDIETKTMASQFTRKKIMYKAKQEQQPPISSLEVDRIARIFSSKNV